MVVTVAVVIRLLRTCFHETTASQRMRWNCPIFYYLIWTSFTKHEIAISSSIFSLVFFDSISWLLSFWSSVTTSTIRRVSKTTRVWNLLLHAPIRKAFATDQCELHSKMMPSKQDRNDFAAHNKICKYSFI